jgi:hypothetical protein
MSQHDSAHDDELLTDHPAVSIPLKILKHIAPGIVAGVVISAVGVAFFGTMAYLPAMLADMLSGVLGSGTASMISMFVVYVPVIAGLIGFMALD